MSLWGTPLDTKKLTLTIVFATLAIVLNPSLTYVALPYPLMPFLVYQLWEIPIVIAFLIISPIAGIAVALLNTSVLFVLFPGALPTGPLYNLLATLTMQIGIYVAVSIGKKIHDHKNPQTNIYTSSKWLLTATGLGALTRVAFMTVILYFALPQTPPIGYAFDQTATNAFLPLSALFNATLALYTIPIGWIIGQRIQKVLHLNILKK
jgi:riboflavin transporter FmnP